MTRTALPFLLAAALALPAAAQEADPRTEAIVAAADAFLATLDESQRAAVQFAWDDDAQRANWSNLPIDMVPRAGVAWGEMGEDQRAALTDLLGAILSEDGLANVQEQMAADEYLKANGSGGGRLTFGSDHYSISFLGAPSAETPWTLQFGGHHLAVNATLSGADVTLAPTLTGGQPVRFAMDGEEVWITEDEVRATEALIASLDEAQRAAAQVSDTAINLVLGPGEDGRTIAPEGLSAADMTEDQRALLMALIETRVGFLNPDDAAPRLDAIEAALDETTFAVFGPLDQAELAYHRVTGPEIVLEYAPQEMGGDPANHVHAMLRWPGGDYGAAWTAD